jgi:hypothetical protein
VLLSRQGDYDSDYENDSLPIPFYVSPMNYKLAKFLSFVLHFFVVLIGPMPPALLREDFQPFTGSPDLDPLLFWAASAVEAYYADAAR